MTLPTQASFNERKLLADFTETDRSAGMCVLQIKTSWPFFATVSARGYCRSSTMSR